MALPTIGDQEIAREKILVAEGLLFPYFLRACLEDLAGELSYLYSLDRTPVLSSGERSSSSTELAASGGTHMDQ